MSGFLAIDDVDGNDSPTTLGVNFYRDIDGNGSDDFGAALAAPSYARAAERDTAQTGAGQVHAEKIIEGTYGYFVLTWSADINGGDAAGTPMGWKWAYHQADMIETGAVAGLDSRLQTNLAAKKTALDALAAGATPTEKIKLEILDDPAGTDVTIEKVISVTVNGRNDAPTISVNAADDDVIEAGHQQVLDAAANGTVTINDVDSEDTPSSLGLSVSADNGNSGDRNAVVIVDRVAGRTVAQVNDDGVPDQNNPGQFIANSGIRATKIVGEYGILTFAWDAAANAGAGGWTWSYQLADQHGDFDGTSLAGAGNEAARQTILDRVDALDEDDDPTDVFTLTVTDAQGTPNTDTITINVDGQNDLSVIADIAPGNGNELADDTATLNVIRGDIDVSDVDGGDNADDLYADSFAVKIAVTTTDANGQQGAKSAKVREHRGLSRPTLLPERCMQAKQSLSTGRGTLDHGTLYIYENGSYTFQINDAHRDVNGLGSGLSIVKTIEVVVFDGTHDSAPKNLVITINGVNDAPVGGPKTEQVNEDTDLVFTADDFTDGYSDAEGHAITHIIHHKVGGEWHADVEQCRCDIEPADRDW